MKRVPDKHSWCVCVESRNTRKAKPVFKSKSQAMGQQWETKPEGSFANRKRKDKKQWGEKVKRVRGEMIMTRVFKTSSYLDYMMHGRSVQFKGRRSDLHYHLVPVQLTNQETTWENAICCPSLPISKWLNQDSKRDFKTQVIFTISCLFQTITTLKRGTYWKEPQEPTQLSSQSLNSCSEILTFLFQIMRALEVCQGILNSLYWTNDLENFWKYKGSQ